MRDPVTGHVTGKDRDRHPHPPPPPSPRAGRGGRRGLRRAPRGGSGTVTPPGPPSAEPRCRLRPAPQGSPGGERGRRGGSPGPLVRGSWGGREGREKKGANCHGHPDTPPRGDTRGRGDRDTQRTQTDRETAVLLPESGECTCRKRDFCCGVFGFFFFFPHLRAGSKGTKTAQVVAVLRDTVPWWVWRCRAGGRTPRSERSRPTQTIRSFYDYKV